MFLVLAVAGKAVLGALAFPRILEFLPVLLPRHFCCLLDKICWERKADVDGEEVADEMGTKLDEILKDEPWKLGFSRVSNVMYGKNMVCAAFEVH